MKENLRKHTEIYIILINSANCPLSLTDESLKTSKQLKAYWFKYILQSSAEFRNLMENFKIKLSCFKINHSN